MRPSGKTGEEGESGDRGEWRSWLLAEDGLGLVGGDCEGTIDGGAAFLEGNANDYDSTDESV
jgi:hypothetical protein